MTDTIYDDIEFRPYHDHSFYGTFKDPEWPGEKIDTENVIGVYALIIVNEKNQLALHTKQLAMLNKYGAPSVKASLETHALIRELLRAREAAESYLAGTTTGLYGKERAEYGIVNINRDIKELKKKMKANDWAICRAFGYEEKP